MVMLKFKKYIFGFLFLLVFSSLINADSFQSIRDKYTYTNKYINKFTSKKYPDLFLSSDKNDNSFSYEAKNIFQLAVSDMTQYSDNKYTKIVLEFDSRSEDQVSEYYYFDNKVYFVFKVVTEYAKNKDDDSFSKADKEIIENRYYFDNNKMIRWINNEKNQVKSSSKKYQEYEEKILKDSKVYLHLKH